MAELYQKLEEGFSAFMKVIMNQYGEQLSGPIKAFLECAICKEVLIQVKFFNPCFNNNISIIIILLLKRPYLGNAVILSVITA